MAIEGVAAYQDPAESAAVHYGIDPSDYADAVREAYDYGGASPEEAYAAGTAAGLELLRTSRHPLRLDTQRGGLTMLDTSAWVVPTQAGDVHGYDAAAYGHGVQAMDHIDIAVGDVAGYTTPADAAEAAIDAGGRDD